MRYVVTPGVGVGAVQFGLAREEVHVRLGPPDQPEDGSEPDDDVDENGEFEEEWEDDGLAVRFDADGCVVEIALFPPASASIGSARLLADNDPDAYEALAAADPDCTFDDGVAVSGALDLVYAEDEDGEPELVVMAPGRLDALAAAELLDETDGGAGETA